jgi:hypothetical protein
MPKRSTTDAALERLTDADRDAMDRKVAALRAIPDPAWNPSIPWDATYSDVNLNTREGEKYDVKGNLGTYTSLLTTGLEKRADPMMFDLTADGRFLVLVGHIRFAMMAHIRAEVLAGRITIVGGQTVGPDNLPFGTIFGLVYPELTDGQRLAIIADHIGRKDLTEYQRCKEIATLQHGNGLTDKATGVHFGVDHNKVARYRMRYAMPTVYAEFKKETDKDYDGPFVKVKQQQLTATHTAYLDDRDAGNGYREEGPAFRRVWTEIIANPEAFIKKTPKGTDGPEPVARQTLINQADGSAAGFGDGFEIQAIADTLRFAAGEDVNLNTIRQTARDSADSLRADVARLTMDVATARDSAREATERADAMTADIDGLRADLAAREKNGGRRPPKGN